MHFDQKYITISTLMYLYSTVVLVFPTASVMT